MENFTPVTALIGGLMIGISAALLLMLNGRIAGISGLLGGLIPPERGQVGWRLAFLAGMFIAPWFMSWPAAPSRLWLLTLPYLC